MSADPLRREVPLVGARAQTSATHDIDGRNASRGITPRCARRRAASQRVSRAAEPSPSTPTHGSTHTLIAARNRIDKDAARRFITHSISTGPANSNAAMARRQAEAAVRERIDADSAATRSNRFRHVAKEAGKFEADAEDEEKEEDEMDMDGADEPPSGNSEDEAAALLAEVDAMDAEDIDAEPVPEPAEARVDPPESKSSRSRTKRKRAEDLA